MNAIETQILTLLSDFCKIIPVHVDKWKDIHKPLLSKVKGITNMAEQLQSVVEVKIDYMDNFSKVQETLQFNILSCIEEDMKFVRDVIDKLSRFNTQVRDKLEKLEKASLQLDWDDEDSILLLGTPLIPPLGRLLQDALEFYTFFNCAYKNMLNCTKNMNYLDEEKMKTWENTFVIDLESEKCINWLIAITQYVDDEVSFD